MPDPNKSKKPVAIIVIVVLLCAVVGGWLIFKPRPATTPNQAPIAALRIDSIDETNRVAVVSDGGSHDPDGTLQSWRIAWGDGKEDNLSSIPQKTAHTYGAEGEYTISLWCVDNLGATSSPPAMTNITFDFLKRQKALAETEAKRQAEAKLAADRLKEEEARKEAARLEQERQKQMQLAALEAQKAREQQELEARRQAEELARQKAEAAKPPPTPLGAAVDGSSSRTAVFTPRGYTLGQFQIIKEKDDGRASDGNFLVILVARCVNFPGLPTPPTDWQIDGKDVHVQSGRVRASLAPGQHEVTALFKSGQAREIKAEVTVEPTGECEVIPRN